MHKVLLHRFAAFSACLLMAGIGSAGDWYVAPGGNNDGVNGGTLGSPWNLQRALSHPSKVLPGDTICVRGGTYRGKFRSQLTGTAQAPIIVRAYPGERATIDGNFSTVSTSALGTAAPYSDAYFDVADSSGISFAAVILVVDPSGGEQMQVTGINGNNIKVVRGWNGSCKSGTCPSHSTNSPVTLASGSDYLTVTGAYTWFWGLEVMYSQGSHVLGANNPPFPDTTGGVTDQCKGCKYINMIIHDSGANGLFSNASAQSTEVYGTLIYYNGIDNTANRAHGHGIYSQNAQMGPPKRFLDNIIFRSFGYGVQIYGTSEAYLDNFQLEGNTFFNAGEQTAQGLTRNLLIGGSNVAQNLVLKDNYAYFPPVAAKGEHNVGYDAGTNSAAINANYLVSGQWALGLVKCTNGSLTGNTFAGPVGGFSSTQYPSNVYYSSRPTGMKVFVRPNAYEPGRANITVFNLDRLDTVSVDISGAGLKVGDAFEIRDVQDFFGSAAVTGNYGGGNVSIPMTGTTVTSPQGYVLVQPVHTDLEFGAFVLLPVSPGGVTPSDNTRRTGRAGSRSR